MKRNRLVALLLVALMLITTFPVVVSAQSTQPIRIFVDGQQVTIRGTQPVIQAGRTLVGARDVFEHLGFEVSWNGTRREARMARADFTLYLWIGESHFEVINNVTNRASGGQLDVPAQIINGSTMIPLRFPLEAVGYTMSWDGANRIANIYTQGQGPVTTPTTTPQPTPTPPPAYRGQGTNAWRHDLTAAEFEQAVFDYVNLWRVELGLQPYVWSDTLAQASRVHSESKLEHEYWAHISTFTGTPTDRARVAGFNVQGHTVREVSTQGPGTPHSAVTAFYTSPGHNYFVTQNFRSGTPIGVGVTFREVTHVEASGYVNRIVIAYVTVKIGIPN